MLFPKPAADASYDVVLIGAGIMSATLGMMLKELQPDITIGVYERLDMIAGESSDAWNNAGTGHSALCELNYTPLMPDGSVDVSKAIGIDESFEISRQFWTYLVQQGIIKNPPDFIRSIPHMSFVRGDADVDYLRKRQQAMTQHHLFEGMQFSDDKAQLAGWIPLIMEGRDPAEHVAATRMERGTDVNFGALTRILFGQLQSMAGVNMHLQHEVHDLDRDEDGRRWRMVVKDLDSGDKHTVVTPFIFIGAGGGALYLLEKSGIPEAAGFGGFPVSGQWLRCTNDAVIARHGAKVYGKASVGTPPMSVPHLDTRVIDGKKALLFGPYAGFSTKFLKHGSLLDLPRSITLGNIKSMLGAGFHNIPLTKYLVSQVVQSPEDRLAALREFMPEARDEDWALEIAGQRVQVIKKDEHEGGVLEFGTEVVAAADGSIAALLGASPGASTAASIMLGLLQRCFKDKVATPEWQAKLKEIIPSYGQKLSENDALFDKVRQMTKEALKLVG